MIEVRDDDTPEVPEEYRDLLREATLVCTPMSAAGRWLGVILSDRGPGSAPLKDNERQALWALGKTAALATHARLATNQHARARQLQERIDLARDVHEGVIQRLFGVQLVFSSQAELSPEARERIAAELQAALFDLRRALQRPLGRVAPETHTTLLRGGRPAAARAPRPADPAHARLRARGGAARGSSRSRSRCSPRRSATRTSTRGRRAWRSRSTATDGTLTLEVANDGVSGRPRQTGMGLRLAALEALQVGGIVEFGEREPGTWRVRLAVPVDRA